MRCPGSLVHVHSCTRLWLSQTGGVRLGELASYEFRHCCSQVFNNTLRDCALSWIKNTKFSVLIVVVPRNRVRRKFFVCHRHFHMLLRFAVRWIGKFSVYLLEIKIQIPEQSKDPGSNPSAVESVFFSTERFSNSLNMDFRYFWFLLITTEPRFKAKLWKCNLRVWIWYQLLTLESHFHNFALNLQFIFNYILCNAFKEPTYACTRTNTCTYNDSSYARLYAALVTSRPPFLHYVCTAWDEPSIANIIWRYWCVWRKKLRKILKSFF